MELPVCCAAIAGTPCSVLILVKSTIRSSARIIARPVNEPWPISDEPMVIVIKPPFVILSQLFTWVCGGGPAMPGTKAAAFRPPAAIAKPSVRPVAPPVTRNFRRLILRDSCTCCSLDRISCLSLNSTLDMCLLTSLTLGFLYRLQPVCLDRLGLKRSDRL